MAHITEVKIDGLLGRSEPIHLYLNRHVNVFFGENGCGKTTLLKILDAALSRDGEAMNLLPVSRAEIYIYSVERKKIIKQVWERSEKSDADTVRKQLVLMDPETIAGEDSRFQYAQMVQAESDWRLTPNIRAPNSSPRRWKHTFLPTSRLYVSDLRSRIASESKAQTGSERQLDIAFAESVNRAWLQFYSKTLTEVRQIQEEGLRTVLSYVLNPEQADLNHRRLDPADVHQRVVKFLSRQPQSDALSLGSVTKFAQRYKSDDNLRRIVDNLDNVERRIESAMIPIDRFTATLKGLFSRGKSIVLANNELQVLLENGKNISLANLSSGEKHLIKILLSAMTSHHNSILIDEPELSMHIDWQRAFVNTVRSLNPDCQLILASHSPEIMADVADECIFRL